MKIDINNFKEANYNIFEMFSKQCAVVTAGPMNHYNAITIGWGQMGNLWNHEKSALTIYVSPNRYTYEFLEREEYFVVSFFPEQYKEDVMYLGTHSGRDEDKVSKTKLTPVEVNHGVGFKEAELTFICKKVYSHQFELEKTPDVVQNGLYKKIQPHYEYIGFIEEVYGEK